MVDGQFREDALVWAVVTINSGLAVGLLWLAWQLAQLRQRLVQVTAGFQSTERATHALLGHAPAGIEIGQRGVYRLRGQYAKLTPQVVKLQKLLWIVGRSQVILSRVRGRS